MKIMCRLNSRYNERICSKDVAIEMNLLLKRLLYKQNDI